MNTSLKCWRILSLEEALASLQDGLLPHPSVTDLVHLLSTCSKQRNKSGGMRLHAHIQYHGLETHRCVGNHLVPMLVNVGSIHDAQQVFDMMAHRNAWSWNSLISGYIKCGEPQHALILYEKMCEQDSVHNTNEHIFVSVLKACAKLKNVKRGSEIHSEVARLEFLSTNPHIGTALIDLYVKCGSLAKAQQVFDQLGVLDVVCWNAIMTGYVDHGLDEKALKQFEVMQLKGISPDANSFVCNLKACAGICAIYRCQEIHADIERKGLLERELEVGNTLVDIYAKFGLLAEAKQVLEMLPTRDVVSWTVLISGYADHGPGEEALKCFEQMHYEGVTPDVVTYVCVLKACGSAGVLNKGQQIHAEIERHGLLEKNLVIGRTLVDMYVNCGFVTKAHNIFERLLVRDVISWTSLIGGYAEHGPSQEAMNCLEQMQLEGVTPDVITFVCAIKACGCRGALDKGQEIHAEVERQGLLEHNLVLGNILVDMYAKCDLINVAQQVFNTLHVRDVVSWNALISGYAESGCSEETLKCYDEMQLDHVLPNAATFICCLKACGSIGDIDKCREIHVEVERRDLIKMDLVIGSTLVDTYGRCGSVARAEQVFDRLPVQDVIAWNALIAGYTEHEYGEQALKCFELMQQIGVCPNDVTFVCSLRACGSTGASDKGMEIHNQIERQGLLESNLLVGNSLIDMYTKCGSLSKARDVFSKLFVRDVITWTSLMMGYALLGESDSVFQSFDRMLGEGIKPNIITFLVILAACSRTGLYHKSQTFFDAMSKEYGIDPSLQHQNCLVDLLSRVGQLDKAVTMIKEMPFCPNLAVWRSVLGACKRWGNVNFAKQAFKHAVHLDKRNAVAYVFMSNIYGGTDLEVESNKIRHSE